MSGAGGAGRERAPDRTRDMPTAGGTGTAHPPLRAVTFDYWDTLYHGHALPERVRYRQEALHAMLARLGRELTWPEFEALYLESGREAERWWREEARGYHTRDRIQWMLRRLGLDRPDDCEHVAAAVRAVDEALTRWPAPLIDGMREVVRDVAARVRLAIVSDTGFASGRAQTTLLERDGLLPHFAAMAYSMDLGHAKPRREPFAYALDALGIPPAEALHVGDNEHTDVRGALDAGMRAVRVDFLRQGGASAAEFVARTPGELRAYLLEVTRARRSRAPTIGSGEGGGGKGDAR